MKPRLIAAVAVTGLLVACAQAQAAPAVKTIRTATGTLTFPVKPTTPAKVKALSAQVAPGGGGAAGQYLHEQYACHQFGVYVNAVYESDHWLRQFGVPGKEVTYPPTYYDLITGGGVAVTNPYRRADTWIACIGYVYDRGFQAANGATFAYLGTCYTRLEVAGYDDGAGNAVISGWAMAYESCHIGG